MHENYTYVASLGNALFGVAPAVRKRKERKTAVVSLASTTVVDFLVENGLPRGNKLASGLRMPPWILDGKEYKIACVRGLMDTDSCLYIHKHRVRDRVYRNIGLCFTSHSPLLMEQAALIFEEAKIRPHISGGGKRIYLYSKDDVGRYLKVFGTSNDRVRSVWKKWRDG